MIRFLLLSILILLLARAFWRVMDGVIEAAGGRRRQGRPPTKSLALRRDPVCGTFVTPSSAIVLPGSDQAMHYFCSERCRDEFLSRQVHSRPHAS